MKKIVVIVALLVSTLSFAETWTPLRIARIVQASAPSTSPGGCVAGSSPNVLALDTNVEYKCVSTTYTPMALGGDITTDVVWAAKGDLIVGTGNDTAAILTVGTNTWVLSADSTTATGLKWVALAGGGNALTVNPLSQFAATTSAQLAGVLTDETGTGKAVFATAPNFVNPVTFEDPVGGFKAGFDWTGGQNTIFTLPDAAVPTDSIMTTATYVNPMEGILWDGTTFEFPAAPYDSPPYTSAIKIWSNANSGHGSKRLTINAPTSLGIANFDSYDTVDHGGFTFTASGNTANNPLVSVSGNLTASNISGTNTGDQLEFKTVATTSGTNPIADLTTDTLTITAGAGISVTGDATTDTVTIANTGVITETDAAHDNCSEITGCVVGATTNVGTVTSVSVTTVNGVSGTVATATTTPEISLTLGDITPSKVTTPTIDTAAAAGSTGITIGPTVARTGTAKQIDFVNGGSSQGWFNKAGNFVLKDQGGIFAANGLDETTYVNYGSSFEHSFAGTISTQKAGLYSKAYGKPDADSASGSVYGSQVVSAFDPSGAYSIGTISGGSFRAEDYSIQNSSTMVVLNGGEFVSRLAATGTGHAVTYMIGANASMQYGGANTAVTNSMAVRVAYDAAPGSGTTITNQYGVYVPESTYGSTVKNGAFFENATNGYKAIAIRDQNVWIGSNAAGQLDLNGTTVKVNGNALSGTNTGDQSCATVSGCVVGALTAEVDGSTTNEIEVEDEAFSAANFNGATTKAVSQDDFYDLWHASDADDNGVVDTTATATFADNDTSIASTAFVTAAAPTYARVSGSDATRALSLVDVTGLTASLTTGRTYEFEAVLMVTSSEATNGNIYAVNYTSTASLIEAQANGTLAAATTQAVRISALNTGTAKFVTVNGSGGILIRGIITTTGTGTFSIMHGHLVSGTSTVRIGSYLKVTRIT